MHLAEVGRRIQTPAVNAVARIMIEAVDVATGFCTMPLAEIARRASCSTTTVKQARSKLNECGLWVHVKGGVFVPCPTSQPSQGLNRNQAFEKTGPKAVRGNPQVPHLYHLLCTDPGLAVPPSGPSKSYQADIFGGEVLDFDQYRRGLLPSDLAASVRAEMRARGVTQDELAVELGISRPQLANVLAGRFGLSPGPAARLLAWLRKAA